MAFRRQQARDVPASVAREIDEELQEHVRRPVESLTRQGLSDADAHRRALEEFGDLTAARRELAAIDGRIATRRERSRWWSGVCRDLRHGVRRLGRQPLASAVMILTLGLAIGASTAVFSVVDQTVLRPAPFLHASRLVDVLDVVGPERRGGGNSLRPATIAGWQRQPALFERFEAYAPRQVDLSGTGEPGRVKGRVVTLGLFGMLGASPLLGRGFVSGDGAPGSEPVVMISEGLWQRRFGGDPSAVGARLLLNEQPHTIVGVMPERFRLLGSDEDLWLPFDADAPPDPDASGFYGIGRLATGLSMDQAQAAADAIAEHLQRQTPIARSWYLDLRPKRVAWVDDTSRQALLVLLGAVGCVLLIACVNVAGLLLGQASRRDRETALRSALGASRARLVREAAAEALVFASAGGLSGILLTRWLVDLVVAVAPSDLAFMTTLAIEPDGRVLAVAALTTAGSGLLCTLLPALRASSGAAAGAAAACS